MSKLITLYDPIKSNDLNQIDADSFAEAVGPRIQNYDLSRSETDVVAAGVWHLM